MNSFTIYSRQWEQVARDQELAFDALDEFSKRRCGMMNEQISRVVALQSHDLTRD